VFHHHCGGFVETTEEVDRLLALTDPAAVGLCLDTGHAAYGGGDPVDWLRRFGDRVRYVHLKDAHPGLMAQARGSGWNYLEAVAAGLFCELGQGCVDFAGALAELGARSYDGWLVVEQDILPGQGTPLTSARRNRAYLRGLGL
jgi:inosose dehydratase